MEATLIGGLALSFYVKPRMTQAIDFLLISDVSIPDSVPGFGKVRKDAFQHDGTHVEVKIVTAQHGLIPAVVIPHIIDRSLETDGFKVASPSGLVASKLFRLSMQDAADIVALITHGTIDLAGFAVPAEKLAKVRELVVIAEREAHAVDREES